MSFYRGEATPDLAPVTSLTEEQTGAVPESMVVEVTPFRVAMRGTEHAPPRCCALQGDIGDRVACSIYEVRPSPCRAFTPSYEDGQRNEGCDDARMRHGLRPLTEADWTPVRTPTGPRPRRRVA